MNRRRHVRIAEVEDIGARGIDERRVERIDPFAPSDDRCLLAARERRERA